jgi:hypothetical protein
MHTAVFLVWLISWLLCFCLPQSSFAPSTVTVPELCKNDSITGSSVLVVERKFVNCTRDVLGPFHGLHVHLPGWALAPVLLAFGWPISSPLLFLILCSHCESDCDRPAARSPYARTSSTPSRQSARPPARSLSLSVEPRPPQAIRS